LFLSRNHDSTADARALVAGFVQTSDQPEQRGLSRPAGADQEYEFSLANLEVSLVKQASTVRQCDRKAFDG
jgi:hypothetical protein